MWRNYHARYEHAYQAGPDLIAGANDVPNPGIFEQERSNTTGSNEVGSRILTDIPDIITITRACLITTVVLWLALGQVLLVGTMEFSWELPRVTVGCNM